jgi:mRNA-degrading endonuclease RelE of RelBE toxin-antitoxin system
MNYKVYLTETFQKSMKILKKKYRRVKDDIAGTIQAIEEDPTEITVYMLAAYFKGAGMSGRPQEVIRWIFIQLC